MRACFRYALSALVILMPACSTAAGDDGESSDENLRIKPVGTETMSTLVVQLPANTCLPGGACTRVLAQQPNITLDGTAMTLGTGLRVVSGKHTLSVGPTKTTITLDAGKTRTMTLPVIRRVCSNGDAANVPTTDFGRVPALHYAACPSNAALDGAAPAIANFYIYSGNACQTYLGQMIQSGQGCAALRAGQYTVQSIYGYTAGNAQSLGCFAVTQQDALAMCNSFQAGGANVLGIGTQIPDGNIAVVPGAYAFQIEGAAAATKFDVNEGDAKDLALKLPQIGSIPTTFDTRLKFDDARELPDAVAATISSNCERNYAVPATAKDTVTLKAFQFAECNYSLSAGGRTVALNQAAAGNDVELHRVDMDDVVVTREDGSTFSVKGTYEVYFGGNKVAGPYNTSTGIDLLGGAYEIVVKYQTAEGQKTNTYDINL